jgi:hypothetical protein
MANIPLGVDSDIVSWLKDRNQQWAQSYQKTVAFEGPVFYIALATVSVLAAVSFMRRKKHVKHT